MGVSDFEREEHNRKVRVWNLQQEVKDAEQWLRDHGHTLFCGEQDQVGHRIDALREELVEIERG